MFKVGDKVFDNERGYGDGVVARIGAWINVSFEDNGECTYTNDGRWSSLHPITLFKKEEKMKTYALEQFKNFAKEIEAYENGEEIQALYLDEWQDCVPKWDIHCKYRVKPKLSREQITANWVKENELKVGDKLKVLKGFEDGFSGINKGQSDYCIGKIGEIEEITTKGIDLFIDYGIWSFPVECLEKVKEEYVPFSLEDRNLFMGKIIKNKEFDDFHIVTYANKEKAGFDGSYYGYEELLEDYEFEGGIPFGRLKL